MGIKEQILPLLSGGLRIALEKSSVDFEHLREIRLRVHQPVILHGNFGNSFLKKDGGLTKNPQDGFRTELKELRQIVECACGYSGYAFEEEIKKGYLTIQGGHRIGLVGKAVMNGHTVQMLKYVTALNVRIAHPVEGCAREWKTYFYEKGLPCHMLLISPPGCGKTTLLRDIIRIYSEGGDQCPSVTVGVVDERSEIAGTYRGIASYDLGVHVDVLDGCPKDVGMEMLLRSMAPQVLAVDEIGVLDVKSLENTLRCGCKILATLHGGDLKDFLEKPGFSSMVQARVFQRYIFLEGSERPGRIRMILDGNFEKVWEERGCM